MPPSALNPRTAAAAPRPGLHLAPTPAPQPKTHSPLAFWHLLSLDAPTIAVLWTVFIAASCHIHLPLATPVAMALAVWTLYAADRLLDARLLDARLLDARLLDARLLEPRPPAPQPPDTRQRTPQGLELRHLFHHRHRRQFLLGISLASILLALLLPHLSPAALRLDLFLGGLLIGYFLVLHATGNAHRLPKEFAVGIFFSAAVFLPTVARNPGLRLHLLPPALLFGACCTLNCLFIYAWEHTAKHPAPTSAPHLTTRLALANLRPLALTLTLASLTVALVTRGPLPLATALSSSILLTLDHARSRVTPLHLRACADLALLTPLLFLPFLSA